jgi:hypothetical protein
VVEKADHHNPDGWTFATLYKHVTMLSDASKEAVTAAMASAEKAVLKADQANEKRFDAVNEFRAAMKDQQSTFADKELTDRRLGLLEQGMASQSGRGVGMNALLGWALGLIMAGVALADLFLRAR